jgi:hypothetical protein
MWGMRPHSERSAATPLTLAELLRPFTTAAIVENTGAHPDTVRDWKRGETTPATQHVRPIAELANRSVDEILAAIEATKRAVA